MPPPALHFIGRSAAAPARIVRWCRERWPGALPAGLVFCVPTSLALRRLRDALTDAYGAFQGVRFLTPSALVSLFAKPEERPLATPAEMLRVWSGVFAWLHEHDPDGAVLACLFPGKREWLARASARYAVARRLMRLRDALAERLLDFAAVAAHPKTAELGARERSRWAALDALEARCRESLAAAGLEDPADRQLAVLRDPCPQPQEAAESWRLVVACVPDLMPALTRLFAAAPACDILVQAEPEEAEHFDAFGLPDPEFWGRAAIDLPGEAIRQAENPAGVARAVADFLDAHGEVDPADLCLGVLDREALPPLTAMLAEHGVSVFEPEPIALGRQPPALALLALAGLARDDRPEAVLPLLALPEAAAAAGADYRTLRSAYDDWVENCQPATRGPSRQRDEQAAPLRDFLARCEAWAEGFRADPVAGARAFLTDLYGDARVDPTRAPLRFAAFEALRDLLNELDGLRVGKAPEADLLAARLADVALRPVRGEADCSYEGRLELLWADAPLLVLAGLNEGLFPDTTFEDAFLPNTFRRALGLRSDATRAARDAYILSAVCAWRKPSDVCLLCARTNARGDWLKPSRLLFRCAPEEQARRAKALFLDAPPAAPVPAPGTALAFAENPVRWGAPPPPERLSPSAIAAFLQSPLLYWLTHVLRLGTTDDLPDGVSASLLGTLVHDALRVLPEVPKTVGQEALAEVLLARLRACFARRFGGDLPVTVLAARRSAERRIRAAARLEATLRGEGWETVHVELRAQTRFAVDGRAVTLCGVLDRVDRNARTGAWRVLDYKTGKAGFGATHAHWTARRGDAAPVWHSFQLPIYRLLAREALGLAPDTPVELAYFALPDEGQAAISVYEDPNQDVPATEADLRRTLAALLDLGLAPLPAEVGPFGDPLLATLTAPTLGAPAP